MAASRQPDCCENAAQVEMWYNESEFKAISQEHNKTKKKKKDTACTGRSSIAAVAFGVSVKIA